MKTASNRSSTCIGVNLVNPECDEEDGYGNVLLSLWCWIRMVRTNGAGNMYFVVRRFNHGQPGVSATLLIGHQDPWV
eukprot:1880680-Rhodomonas_salina.1